MEGFRYATSDEHDEQPAAKRLKVAAELSTMEQLQDCLEQLVRHEELSSDCATIADAVM